MAVPGRPPLLFLEFSGLAGENLEDAGRNPCHNNGTLALLGSESVTRIWRGIWKFENRAGFLGGSYLLTLASRAFG